MLIKIKRFSKKRHFLPHQRPLWKTAVAWSFVFTKNLFGGQSHHRLKRFVKTYAIHDIIINESKEKLKQKNYHDVEIHSFSFFFFRVEEFEFTVKFKSETFLSPLYQRVFFIVVVDQTKWYLGGFFLFWTFSPSWQRNMYCYALFFSWTDINLEKEENVHHLCSMHIFFFNFFLTFLMFLTLWVYANSCVKQLSK